MNKDMKTGLVIGTAFAALVSAMPTKAQDKITDEDLCEKAVAYSVKYLKRMMPNCTKHEGTSSRVTALTILRNSSVW